MKISDEIRNWREFEDGTECGGFVTKASFDKLCDLADRIDAEMVELPRDRDGVPIHVGDVMESNGANSLFGQASFEVRAMRYDEGGWEVYDRLGDRYMPSLLRHHHAPTVEDVLREFAEGLGVPVADSYVAASAAKLRLAERME